MTADKETWILYQTTNLVNGKIYVGVHKLADTTKSKNYLGSGLALRPAIEKYGRENFVRSTLAEFSCAKDAYLAEADVVTEEFINRPDTYNIKLGGLGCKGLIHNEETRAKLSAASKGRTSSAETKAKISAAVTGNKNRLGQSPSEETRLKLSASHKGVIPSAETRLKIGAAHIGNKYNLGRKHSKEAREKIAEANRNRITTEETKAKITSSLTGLMVGAKNYRSVAVVINGKYYESVRIAAKAEQTNHETVKDRVINTKEKWSEWRYATEKEKLEYTSRNKVLTEGILDLTK
jgi:group I intron endonuclease